MSMDKMAIFVCSKCKKANEKMKILPCDIYCENCVTDILSSIPMETGQFFCDLCDEIHILPKNGFKDFQPQLDISKLYRGETCEKLKLNLLNIESSIEEFKTQLRNSAKIVMDHCLNLRNQVQLETELLIKKLQDINEEKIQKIDEYEKNCLSSQIYKPIIELNIIEEAEKFLEYWRSYLENICIQENELKVANNLSDDILKRIENEKIKTNLFDVSILEFHKNQPEISQNIAGSLYFRNPTNLSLKNSRTIYINEILNDFNQSFHDPIFEVLEDQRIVAGFLDTQRKFNLTLINTNLEIDSRFKSEKKCFKFDFSINTNQIALLIFIEGKSFLQLFDLDLKMSKQKSLFVQNFQKICSNEEIICILFNGKLNIFDWELNFVKYVGQSYFPFDSFFIQRSLEVKFCFLKHSELYLFYEGYLDIMDIKSGKKMNSFKIAADKLRFDSNGNLLFWFKYGNRVFRYNSSGILLQEIDIGPCINEHLEIYDDQDILVNREPDIIDFIVFKNGEFLFFR